MFAGQTMPLRYLDELQCKLIQESRLKREIANRAFYLTNATLHGVSGICHLGVEDFNCSEVLARHILRGVANKMEENVSRNQIVCEFYGDEIIAHRQ